MSMTLAACVNMWTVYRIQLKNAARGGGSSDGEQATRTEGVFGVKLIMLEGEDNTSRPWQLTGFR